MASKLILRLSSRSISRRFFKIHGDKWLLPLAASAISFRVRWNTHVLGQLELTRLKKQERSPWRTIPTAVNPLGLPFLSYLGLRKNGLIEGNETSLESHGIWPMPNVTRKAFCQIGMLMEWSRRLSNGKGQYFFGLDNTSWISLWQQTHGTSISCLKHWRISTHYTGLAYDDMNAHEHRTPASRSLVLYSTCVHELWRVLLGFPEMWTLYLSPNFHTGRGALARACQWFSVCRSVKELRHDILLLKQVFSWLLYAELLFSPRKDSDVLVSHSTLLHRSRPCLACLWIHRWT